MLSISTCRRSSLLLHFIATTRTSVPLSSYHHCVQLSVSSSSDSDDDPSPSSSSTTLTVGYLVKSWGLSLSTATAVAAKARVTDPSKADRVLKFLKDHSFTATQIASLIRKRPELLGANPKTRLMPKLDFFRRIGLSGADFAKVVTSNPSIICSKLESVIMVAFDYLKGVLGSDERVILAIKRGPFLLHINIDHIVAPNIRTLRNHNVPEQLIARIFLRQPLCITACPEKFAAIVMDVKGFGFDPSSWMFTYAVMVMSGMSTETWNKKVDVYRSLGWSDEDIFNAFKRHPNFIGCSEEKIRTAIDFLMGRLHLKPKEIYKYPSLLTYNLVKTIIPRCCVLNVLISKGILSKDSYLLSKLQRPNAYFEQSFVARYQDKFPEVLEAYEGKMKFEGFGL